MTKGMYFFRIKSSWMGEDEKGFISPIKAEDLVTATCYADAEIIALKLLEGKEEFGSTSYEITKTKITEMLYNSTFNVSKNLLGGLVEYYFTENEDETGEGLYAVNVIFTEINEKTGKSKNIKETIYTPAVSPQDAINFIKLYLADEQLDWLIRDVKFDKAQSVMVTPQDHKLNVDRFSKYE